MELLWIFLLLAQLIYTHQQTTVLDRESIIKKLFSRNPGAVTEPMVPTVPTAPTVATAPTLKPTQRSPETDKECVCVPYYQCRKNRTVNTDGENIFDVRSEGCGVWNLTCCFPPDIEQRQKFQTTECGKRNPSGVVIRLGDVTQESALFGEFPWMVAVLSASANDNRDYDLYKCGGALIHPKAVLTGAHCVIDKSKKYIVRAGEWDTENTDELLPHQNRKVETSVIHPKFNSGNLRNNIALLILETPFDLDRHIDVICLPQQDQVISGGTRCFATGWGKENFGKGNSHVQVLKKIELPIVDNDSCQERFRKTRLGIKFNLHESFVCAGGEEGRDTCEGDHGSPLVCPIEGSEDRFQHVGMVSWGIGCNDPIPAAYTSIPHFRKWIDDAMTKNNLDTTVYS